MNNTNYIRESKAEMDYSMNPTLKKSLSLFLAMIMVVLAIPTTVFTALAGEGVTLGDNIVSDSVSIWDGAIDTSWYDSSKSEFELSGASQLAGLARLVNDGNTFEGKIINLVSDIDWNSKEWNIIGKGVDTPFMGTFNGNHNSILGAVLSFGDDNTVSTEYVGIFGYIKEATINALGVSECRIDGVNTTLAYVGGLVGYSVNSVVNDCYVSFTEDGNRIMTDHVNPLDRDDVLYKTIDDILVETHGGDLSVYKNPNGQGMVLDLRNAPNIIDYSIDIKGDVSALRVIGSPDKKFSKLKFNIGEGDLDVYLEFVDMKLEESSIKVDLSTAPEGYVMDRTVYLVSSGGDLNYLRSNNGTAIDLPDSPFHILGDAELLIEGQSGRDGSSGNTPANGEGGYPALCASRLTVSLTDGKLVSFVGGDGGKGGNGANGNNATSTGGSGTAGVDGANGGNGGKAIVLTATNSLYEVFLISGNISFYSGNAGAGGNGGNGGNGKAGSNGTDAYKGSWFFSAGWHYGTDGGRGGNGGNGGKGGMTGYPGELDHFNIRRLGGCNGTVNVYNGAWAKGGDGGRGGDGGKGGEGGSCDGKNSGSGCTHGGYGGDGGNAGAGGHPGTGMPCGTIGEHGTVGQGGIHRKTLRNCSCRSDGSPGVVVAIAFREPFIMQKYELYGITEFPVVFDPPAYVPGISEKTIYSGAIAGYFEGGSIVNVAVVISDVDYSLDSKDEINITSNALVGLANDTLIDTYVAGTRKLSSSGELLGYDKIPFVEDPDDEGFTNFKEPYFSGTATLFGDHIEVLDSESRDESGILYSVRRDPFNPSKLVDLEVAVGLNSTDSRDTEGRYTDTLGNEVNTSEFTGRDAVIPDYVFTGNFLNKVTEISRYAFYKSDIQTVQIGKNVEYIYDASFRECDNLFGIFVDDENPVYKNMEDGSDPVEMYCGSVLYKTMVEGDFTVNGKLAELSADIVILAPAKADYSRYQLPESVYGINDYAFFEVTGLTSVDLSGIRVIGKNAFMSSGLTSVTGASIRGDLSIGDYAFMGCYELGYFSKDIVISEIGAQGFYGSAFTEFTIGKEVKSIGSEAFGGCNYLVSIDVNEENENYCNINSDGILYSIEGREMTLLQYPVNKADQSYTLPAGVTALATGAFKGAKNIRQVSLGADLERIGGEAFFGCRKLATVYIGGKVSWINNSGLSENPYASSVFTDCPVLKSIEVEKSNERFFDDEGVLYERINGEYYLICYPSARSALSYEILEGTVVIGASSIYRNTALVQLHIPAGVREIDLDAISYNGELLGIYFNSGAMSIHSKAIANNNSSMFLYYPESEIESWRGKYGNNLNFSSYGTVNGVIDTSISNSKNPYIIAIYDIDGNPLGNDIYFNLKAIDSKGNEDFVEQTVYNGYVLLDIDINNEEYTYEVSVTDTTSTYKAVFIPDMALDGEVRMSVITLSKNPKVNGLEYDAYGNDGETDYHRGASILTDKQTVNISVYNEGLRLKLNLAKSEVQETVEYLILKNGALYKRYQKDANGVWKDQNGLVVGYSHNNSAYTENPSFKYLMEGEDDDRIAYAIAPADAELREDNAGTLTLILPAGDFAEGDVLSVQATVVYGASREVSEYTELNLNIVDFDETIIDALFGDIQWDFADNLLAFLGESEFEIGGSKDIAKKMLMDNIVKKISLDMDITVDGDELTISFGGQSNKEKTKDFGSKANYRPGKGFAHGAHGETTKSKSFSIMGDVVFKYYEGKLHLTECGVAGTLSFEHSVQLGCFVVWVIPVVIEAEIGVSGQLKIDVLFDQEGGVPVFDNVRAGITVAGSVTFRAGIGCFVASVGAYGKVELSLHFEVLIPDGDGELILSLNAEAGIYAKVNIGFFKVKYEKSLVSFKASVGGKWDSEGWHWVAEADGDIIKFADAAAYAIAVGSDDSIYTDAYDPQIISYEKDGKINYVSLYIANVLPLCEKVDGAYIYDGVEYDALNYAKIVYSVYDEEAGAWQTPVILDNNGLVDGEFSAISSSSDIYIAYTQMGSEMSEEMANDESKTEALSAFEMKLVGLNGTELLWSEAVTSDSLYDSAPSLVMQNGLPTVYWAKIPSGNLFGLTSNSDNCVYRADFDTVEAGVAASGLPSITALSATTDGFALITDIDGIISSLDAEGNQILSMSDRVISFYDAEGNVILQSGEGEYSSFGFMGTEPTVLVNGDILFARDVCTGSDKVTVKGTTVGLSESYKAVYNEKGELDAIFFVSVAPTDEDCSNLYVIFNTENGFNSPIAVTNNGEGVYVEAFGCEYVARGEYLVTLLDTDGEGVFRCSMGDSFNQSGAKVTAIGEKGSVKIGFTLSNTGLTPIEVIDVELYDLNGYFIDSLESYTLPEKLYSGQSKYIEITLDGGIVEASALRDGVDRELRITAKGVTKSDKLRTGYVDLSLAGKVTLIGRTQYVLLYVQNKGNVKAVLPKIGVASSEYVYCEGTDYPYVTSSPFYSTDYELEPGESTYVTVKADEEFFTKVFGDTEESTGDISVTVFCRYDDFDTVDNTLSENISIFKAEEYVFDKSAPEDIFVPVNTSSSVYVQSLKVMGTEVSLGHTVTDEGKLLVYASALAALEDGKYTLICTMSDGTVMNIPLSVINYYTVTWIIGEEKIVETYKNGDVPEFLGDTDKASTPQYKYTFLGWEMNGELVNVFDAVSSDVTYTARYSESVRNYTVIFDVYGNEYTFDLLYGEMPSDKGIDTYRAPDAQYTYEFISWDREISEVTGDITYKALYDKTLNEYKITWVVNGVETVETYPYGEMPSDAKVDKSSTNDGQYTYKFSHWDSEIKAVTGDRVYTAVFVKELNKYTVTWNFGDESITGEVEYGKVPVFDGVPQKPSDAMYDYTFSSWDKEPVAVTGDTEYTAVFTSTLRKYSVSFIVDDKVFTDEYEYGTVPSFNGDTGKSDTFESYFIFEGWDKPIEAVTEDVTYYGVFTEIPKASSKVQLEIIAPNGVTNGESFKAEIRISSIGEGVSISALAINRLVYDSDLASLQMLTLKKSPADAWSIQMNNDNGVITLFVQDKSGENPITSCDELVIEMEFTVSENAMGGNFLSFVISSGEYMDFDGDQYFTGSCDAEIAINNTGNGFSTEDGKLYYYKDGKKVSGWFEHDGLTYYASTSTNVVINYSKKISGKYYIWNDETGLVIADGFVTDENGTKCYEDGVQVIGWRHADGSGPKVVNGISEQYSSNPEGLYYFLSTTGYMVTSSTYKLGGYNREFNEDHTVKPMNGLQTNAGELYYYVEGVKQTGWQTIDGKTYYFRASDAVYGRAATKWMYIGNKVYYFYASTSATPYALKDEGKIGGIEYTYHEDGYILYNGFVNCDFANAANSNTAANIQKMNGTTRYYKNGEMQTGWQQIDGNWYYFYAIGSANGSGYMCTESRKIGGVYYEFTPDGVCVNK